MDIFVDRSLPVPPFKQIKDQIKELIASGRHKENEMIGSVRKIAQITGVSLATVQKAFSELKQDRLIYAKPGEGYFVAKQSAVSTTVFVLLPSNRLTFYTYILDGMFDANRNNELNIQIFSLDTDKLAWNERTIELLQIARREKYSVIFVEEAFGRIRKECALTAQRVPFVTVEWILPNAVSIVNDYHKAGVDMIMYLVKKREAKSIVVLKGRDIQYNAQERLVGIADAVEKVRHKQPLAIEFVDTDFDAISAYQALRSLYAEGAKFDAVICANDYEAMGAMGAFLEQGVLVGKDVALMGFGNIIDTITSYIPLTTIDQRLKLIGRKAIEAILHELDDLPGREAVVEIPTRLIERKT